MISASHLHDLIDRLLFEERARGVCDVCNVCLGLLSDDRPKEKQFARALLAGVLRGGKLDDLPDVKARLQATVEAMEPRND